MVRFHVTISSVLQELGRDDLRERAEISRMLPQGATCEELISIVCEWQTTSEELWSILKEEWNRRYGVVIGTDVEFLEDALERMQSPVHIATPAMSTTEMRLISFRAHKVAFEIVLPTTPEDEDDL